MPDQAPPLPSINEVLDEMDIEVGRCIDTDDRRGYFALMYRGVTRRVRDGLRDNEFPDPEVMEDLDVLFATRWLDACRGWWDDAPVTSPWRVAFDASLNEKITLMQHLMLGMNAHINFDLGIAAAETVDRHPQMTIDDLHDDFMSINEVLGSLIDEMQDAMATVSPWMGIADWAAARFDEDASGFAIEWARDQAWEFARELSAVAVDERAAIVDEQERTVAQLAEHIADPPWPVDIAIWIARIRERHDLRRVDAALA